MPVVGEGTPQNKGIEAVHTGTWQDHEVDGRKRMLMNPKALADDAFEAVTAHGGADVSAWGDDAEARVVMGRGAAEDGEKAVGRSSGRLKYGREIGRADQAHPPWKGGMAQGKPTG
jgi:hypothetical protein